MKPSTTLFVFFAFVAGSLAGPVHNRVVGGEDAQPHQFPHQVSLQFRFADGRPPQHFCGGSVVNELYVLTAAHCYKEDGANGVVEVVVGKHNLNFTEETEQRHRVAKFVVHEDYVGGVAPHDLALIKVTEPFELNQYVKPVVLPKAFATPSGQCTISGWGSTSRTAFAENPAILQTADLPVITNEECSKMWSVSKESVHEYNVCAGDLDGSKGTCKGDSGGPLVQQKGSDFVQIGVVSWGAFPCGVKNAPGVYVGVSNYLGWIQKQQN